MNKTEQINKEIKLLAEKLQISIADAKELYEFDHSTDSEQKKFLESLGIKEKQEEKKEEKKASAINKVTQMKKKAEIDELKEEIKVDFIKFLEENDKVINPQEIKNNQFGFMDSKGNFYSFKLTKHKTIQTGYKI